MDAFELRDQLVARLPWNCAGIEISTVYDDDHQVLHVHIVPDLSRAESDAEIAYLTDTRRLRRHFLPVMNAWLAAPATTRIELARLLGASNSLSDEDGVTITRTRVDVGLVPERPVVE
jgi:hypothetical protein